MRIQLLGVIACVILLVSANNSALAISESSISIGIIQTDELDLPSALAEDDSFKELPFEQLRQALREEVERDPTKEFKHPPSERYNFLIR